MVNALSCTVQMWMHLGDVLGGLSSQELEVSFTYVIGLLNENMKHARAIYLYQLKKTIGS